jgi:hypothetical protein
MKKITYKFKKREVYLDGKEVENVYELYQCCDGVEIFKTSFTYDQLMTFREYALNYIPIIFD